MTANAANPVPDAKQFARDVAAVLGTEWAVGNVYTFGAEHRITLKRPDGPALYLRVNQRVVITGDYPYGYTHADDRFPHQVTVAASRGALVVGQEIVRRFLPHYTRAYATAVEQKRRDEEYEEARKKVAGEVAALIRMYDADAPYKALSFRIPWNDPSKRIGYRDMEARVQVDVMTATRADLKLDNAPVDLVKPVLLLIQSEGAR